MKVDLKLLKKREQTRNRVRLHRGVNQILLEQSKQIQRQLKNRNCNISQECDDTAMFSDAQQFTYSSANERIDKLRMWVHDYNISQRAVSNLLKLLISFGLDFLPMDCRTLMRTPISIQIDQTANGKFWYDGIDSNIKRIISSTNDLSSISLQINIDGLPLFESSNINMWPFLIRIPGKVFQF